MRQGRRSTGARRVRCTTFPVGWAGFKASWSSISMRAWNVTLAHAVANAGSLIDTFSSSGTGHWLVKDGPCDDLDADGVCDAVDACYLDNSYGDGDMDGICDLSLAVGDVVPSANLDFDIANAPPGARVSVVASRQGEGMGPCAPGIGVCSGILRPFVLASGLAGPTGEITLSITVPPIQPGLEVWFQAVWIDPTAGRGETSNVVAAVAN